MENAKKMPSEWTRYDKKSLRLVDGPRPDFQELALDCVAFATAHGGVIDLGIEDGESGPPASQRVQPELPGKVQRRIAELTVNVDVRTEIITAPNGGQHIALHIPRSGPLPSTSDGRYAIRVTDSRTPVVGDDVLRLANERATFPWETQTSLQVSRQHADTAKVAALVQRIRSSDRIKPSVKEKTDSEILDHYALARGPHLTNLGILCTGTQADRNLLGTAPVIQVIKYDEQQQKVNKLVWDDYDSPSTKH